LFCVSSKGRLYGWANQGEKKNRYQRAFIDFFEDQLVSKRYDLRELLDEYLLGGKEPLINGMISGRALKCFWVFGGES
jgi:hypothetical protein